MIEGWPDKIMAAQQTVSLMLKGRAVPRIRYGDEHDDLGANNTLALIARFSRTNFACRDAMVKS